MHFDVGASLFSQKALSIFFGNEIHNSQLEIMITYHENRMLLIFQFDIKGEQSNLPSHFSLHLILLAP